MLKLKSAKFIILIKNSKQPNNVTNNNITYCHRIVQIPMQDNIAKRSLHYVLPYGIGTNVVRIFYIRKEKGEYLQIKTKKLKKESENSLLVGRDSLTRRENAEVGQRRKKGRTPR